ncbi:MAG: phosphohistidine phosphatase SixA [Xenococcaceae cyanobacterium MO_188.B29]|nr:phosphohistidine phosphatase SixA [Xenococcaceae cyanobacterium MO_188.B29]
MEIYLIRHGIAAERGTYDQDEERPLTNKGINKTTLVAKKLAAVGLKFDLILTSPLVRAYQTAEILQQIGLNPKIAISQSLSPNGNIQEWLDSLKKEFSSVNSDYKLALVGHQPDLGNWAEMLVWGSIKEQIIVKKAGVIGLKILDLDRPLGTSELFLLASPKWLI